MATLPCRARHGRPCDCPIKRTARSRACSSCTPPPCMSSSSAAAAWVGAERGALPFDSPLWSTFGRGRRRLEHPHAKPELRLRPSSPLRDWNAAIPCTFKLQAAVRVHHRARCDAALRGDAVTTTSFATWSRVQGSLAHRRRCTGAPPSFDWSPNRPSKSVHFLLPPPVVSTSLSVVWTSLGPLPRWVPGPTTRWAPGTTRLALHGTWWRGAQGLRRRSTRLESCTCPALYGRLLDVLD
jgi:hypothetical protein